jgi:mannonate dehydratase
MKLGLGLYRSMLTTDNFRFARQAGATHIVAHLVDYFKTAASLSTGSGGDAWGVTQNQHKVWTYEELSDLRKAARAEGLDIAAIENFDPSHWYDILLDGPQKKQQIEGIKTIIRNMGQAGIPCMGYNFSLAGVWGRTDKARARGDAPAVGYLEAYAPPETPIPNGQIWNMIYDPQAPAGTVAPVTSAEMWERLRHFLSELLPVADEAGVQLALHPDDPPFPTLRGAGRVIYQPQHYQQLLELFPNRANALEFCVGTLSEMTEGNIYDVVEQYSQQHKIAYVHLRNIVGKLPNYQEVFIDEGDTDMYRVLQILYKNGFEGVIIPDHTPQMTCDAPWHAGMAYALGWIGATISAIQRTAIN